jgi:hypothetical protein
VVRFVIFFIRRRLEGILKLGVEVETSPLPVLLLLQLCADSKDLGERISSRSSPNSKRNLGQE